MGFVRPGMQIICILCLGIDFHKNHRGILFYFRTLLHLKIIHYKPIITIFFSLRRWGLRRSIILNIERVSKPIYWGEVPIRRHCSQNGVIRIIYCEYHKFSCEKLRNLMCVYRSYISFFLLKYTEILHS